METLKNFGFVANKVDPGKLGVIIDETNIIIESTN
jgi:hypothetical protein